MSKEYDLTYKTRYNFLTWCNYWLAQGCHIRHTSWKPNYPNFKRVENNSDELIEEYGVNKYMHKGRQFFAIDDKDYPCFFDRATLNKGEWMAKPVKDITDLFE
jgi:hypothetical protein